MLWLSCPGLRMSKIMNDETAGISDTLLVSAAPETLDPFSCFAPYSVYLAITRLCQSRLTPLGVTSPPYRGLRVPGKKDRLTVSGIGARVRLSAGTLSQLPKRLPGAAILCRQRVAKNDKRRIAVSQAEQSHPLNIAAAGVSADRISVMATGCSEPGELTVLVATRREKRLKALP